MLSQIEESVRSLSAQGEARSRVAGAVPKVQRMGKRLNEQFRCYLMNAGALLTRTIG